jgi:hypothetical protein
MCNHPYFADTISREEFLRRQGRRNRGAQGARAPPPPNLPFFVMKSALFVQANVAVNTKLTSKVPFLFGNFDVFKNNLVKKVQFRYGTSMVWYDGKHFREIFFRCPCQYPKVPLEAGAPSIF